MVLVNTLVRYRLVVALIGHADEPDLRVADATNFFQDPRDRSFSTNIRGSRRKEVNFHSGGAVRLVRTHACHPGGRGSVSRRSAIPFEYLVGIGNFHHSRIWSS